MFPILLNLGPVVIYTAHVLNIAAWVVFAFVFWRYLRVHGILEERIFDLTFYGTIAYLVGGRLGYIFLYPKLFSSSLLLVGAFWVVPGLWIIIGMLSSFLAFFLYSKRMHIRIAHVFDASIVALPFAMIPITLGIFFQGDEPGVVSTLNWGVLYKGVAGVRHPVQLYELLLYCVLGLVMIKLVQVALTKKWQAGMLGAGVVSVLTPMLFLLEFFKVGTLYLYGINSNQWVLILIFAESFGLLFTKGRGIQKLKILGGRIYERFNSRRHAKLQEPAVSRTNPTTDEVK